MNRIFRLIVLSLCLVSCSSAFYMNGKRNDISPLDFGLSKAKTGTERYEVLLKTHQAAALAGVNVDYTGIDTIKIEIPATTERIPLTQYNDFKGCVFVIKNTTKDCWLFDNTVKGKPVEVSKQMIDKGNFRGHAVMRTGRYLLLIEDEKPWVLNRKGHNYGHQRKDILLIENGVAKNNVVMPYDNIYSSPKCSFISLGNEPFVFKNLTIERDPECTFLTHIASIVGHNDVLIQKVIVHTPPTDLANDRGILIDNCTNVTLEDVCIDGTYSRNDHSGYGVCMNNVWNFRAVRMNGRGSWGVFGNNNINTARIEDSQINRFDIHCYGRDISFKNVSFFDLNNQFSSVFGTIQFDRCSFTDFIPIGNSGSYNSYVAHNVVFNDCVFNASPNRNYLFKLLYLNEPTNARRELAEKCMPNVIIRNLTVNMRKGAEAFFVFYCAYSGTKITDIGHLSKIDIDGMVINSDENKPVKGLTLSNTMIQTKSAVDCQMRDVIINQSHSIRTRATTGFEVNVDLKANMTLKGDMVVLRNVEGLKQ